MATTTFVDTSGTTPGTLIVAAWLNNVNTIAYTGLTTQILVGGGSGVLGVWTAATGTGAPVRAAAPTISGVPIFSGIPSLTGGALHFPAAQVPSSDVNDLDDYEEGTFTGTLTGCTTSPTGTINYTKIGNQVTITIPEFTGTSNATTKTITGMPTALRPASGKIFVGAISDNSGATVASQTNINSSGVITNYANLDAGNWTGSGTAAIRGNSYTYTLV